MIPVNSLCFRCVPSLARWFGKRHVVALAALVLAVSLQTFGQQAATIVGTVTDPSGAVVPNVTMTITNLATGVTKTTPTNEAGQYVFPDVQIGKYDVKVTAQGFKAQERKGVVLNANDRVRVDFQMQVGATTETVTVEAAAINVQTDSGEQSSLVNDKQITELATKNRTIYSYAALTTGASNLNPDTQVPVPVGGASGNISFNGNRPGHNLYLLDGGENSDRGGAGSSSVLPSMDAIAQTEVLTSNYSAEYGLSSGGTISSVTKSGTTKYHASAWEFFQNDALQARNFFNPAPGRIAEFRYNVFGFNVGGPVPGVGHKLFFFYNMEWRRLINGTQINTTVPLPSTYGGNFGTTTITVPSTASASYMARNCPGGALPAGVVPGQPFPNNTIPACMLEANAQSLLTAGGKYGGIFPAPTNGAQFQAPVSLPNNLREEITRIDYNATSKFTIYGTFVAEQVAQNLATSMWSGDNVPSVGNTFGNPSYAGVLHTAYVIRPNLVNEASFNYNGNRIHITPAGLVSAPSSFQFNPFFPHTGDGANVQNRIPSIQLAGGTGTNYTVNWMPWSNKADSYQIRDDVSWTKGRHQLKIGGGWLLYKKIQDWFKNTQGGFVFNGSFTGNDFADYLLGLASTYNEDAIKSTGHWNNASWALYVQDNYRVNNKLTLNLGLRWDGIPHTYEASNKMNNFYPNLYNQSNAAVLNPGNQTVSSSSPGLGTSPDPALPGSFYVNGIGSCGLNGIPKGCVDGSWKNFQPRLGFAYDLSGGTGKTVIRGGYALMNERIQGNDVYNNAGTVPLAASISFPSVALSNPNTSVLNGQTQTPSIPINNITGLDRRNYRSPLSSQFSLGVQHSLGKSVLSVAYVGSQNRHQNYYTETNLPDPSLLPGFTTTPALRQNYNANVPYLGYHSIRVAQDEANGDYNSMQASIRGSLKSDLQYQVGYTYSHTNDAGSQGNSAGDLGNISNPYAGWKYDFGPSPYDHHQIFFTNFVYDIPLFKNSDSKALKTGLGGWEISGIVSAETGAPINLGMTGQNVASVVPNSSNRPNRSGSGSDPHTVTQWFDTSVYSGPAAGTWGNTPRSSVWGPGRHNWNLSLFKNFWFSQERGSNLQFRAEFFNVWNHTQFRADGVQGGISNNFGSSNFGHITSAYDPRTIQLALKLSF